MKKIIVISLILVLALSMNVAADGERMKRDTHQPDFRMGVGYIAIPDQSGILLEGTVGFTPQFDVFVGLVPFGDNGDGFIFKSVGADYKFNTDSDSGFRPGLGVVAVYGEGFSPTASINISDPEKDQLSFTLRGGYNVFSGSVQFKF